MIVDLKSRATQSETDYARQQSSPSSLVFVNANLLFPDGPSVFELHVGDVFFFPGDASRRELPTAGFKLGVGASVILETKEEIKVPKNMAGIVLGKGALIFKGLIISPGKIDPTFSGKLLIGLFNGGTQGYQVKPGAAFCNCMFIQCETDSDVSSKHNPQPVQPHKPAWHIRIRSYVARNKAWIAILISLLSLIVSAAKSWSK